ncbi:MAG: zf-HC2 domain-containing protein [Spirochaetota bacterium]
MCPESSLLSAWLDGEVPSPWNERIDEHVASCEACGDRVGSWRLLSGRLHAESPGSAESLRSPESAVVDRIAARLGIRLDARLPGPTAGKAGRRNIGGRAGLLLPLPLAAAAAVVLMLTGALASGLFSSSRPPALAAAPPASAQQRGGGSTATAVDTGSASSPTMEALVRYLETQNAPVNITIELPVGTAFPVGGEPVIVKVPMGQTVSLSPPGSSDFLMTGTEGSGR